MISELVDVWNWLYGIVAGWGAITTVMIVALIVLYIKHFRLKNQVSYLYSRLIATEREFGLSKGQDQ